MTEQERATIAALAQDIPALWDAPATTNVERKHILRCRIDRVVVHVRCDSEHTKATIHWKGGYESHHAFMRPVKTYAQLRDFEALMAWVVELRQAGRDAAAIAAVLNEEGFRPPKHPGSFNKPMIYQLLKRRGLIGNERRHDELLGPNEWWLTDLARELHMSDGKLRDWSTRGWAHYRKNAGARPPRPVGRRRRNETPEEAVGSKPPRHAGLHRRSDHAQASSAEAETPITATDQAVIQQFDGGDYRGS